MKRKEKAKIIEIHLSGADDEIQGALLLGHDVVNCGHTRFNNDSQWTTWTIGRFYKSQNSIANYGMQPKKLLTSFVIRSGQYYGKSGFMMCVGSPKQVQEWELPFNDEETTLVFSINRLIVFAVIDVKHIPEKRFVHEEYLSLPYKRAWAFSFRPEENE